MELESNSAGDDNGSTLEVPLLTSNERRRDDSDRSEFFVDGLPYKTSLLIKSLYFLDALGSSTWGRFSAVYYNLHNLQSAQIGCIEGIRTVIPTISQVAWGITADKWQSRKSVWLLTKVCSTISLLALALPLIYQSFWRILFASAVAQLFVSDGLLDAYTLDLLGQENKLYYGRYRLYASLSWGVGSMVIGWITDRYGFEPNFILFALLSGLMVFLVAWYIPETGTNTATVNQEEDDQAGQETVGGQESVCEDDEERVHIEEDPVAEEGTLMELVAIIVRPQTLLFLLEVIIMGAAMATVERLLFLYLINDLQASTFICGLSVFVNVLFELPIFLYASQFMALLGHDGLMIVAMACFSFRVWGYTLLTPSTKLWILPLEVLHGITFACYWTVATDIAKILVHQTTATQRNDVNSNEIRNNRKSGYWSTVIPTSVNMLYSAVGSSLGSVLGGWAMHKYGSRRMYTIMASIVFGALVLHILGTFASRVWFGSSFLPSDNGNGDGDESCDDVEDDEDAETE
ncbi:unnamed protein product [Cylindrotheca closterium]|uniref:Major facilitator superfamily associated domain-containing protein n=1 Tax=Cylindrotheca closterium TaxID=2856 RepID=A0AAD2G2B8_9STRA|nr:unnamed protein product [Cylindrotheca closterium]